MNASVPLFCIQPGGLPQIVPAPEEDPSFETNKQHSPNMIAKGGGKHLTKKLTIINRIKENFIIIKKSREIKHTGKISQ